MARHGLRRNQQAGANIFAQIDILIRRQQRTAVSSRRRMVIKLSIKFCQLFAGSRAIRSGSWKARIGIHRGVVVVVIRQRRLSIWFELVHLEDNAVVVHLAKRRRGWRYRR
jgi:hypothetical protein